MSLTMAPINNKQMNGPYCEIERPSCTPENDCFIASYMTPSSTVFVDTYLTRPDKKYQLTVPDAAHPCWTVSVLLQKIS